MLAPNSWPSLVLNADFRPLNYFPLSLWSWQDSVKAVFLERVNVVSQYDQVVHSPSIALKLPSVISLKEYIPAARRPAFTRFNVFLRDHFSCQYCGARRPTHELTFDHLVPRSRGGRTMWENVVTACNLCNLRKGNRLPREAGMAPHMRPVAPSTRQLQENGRAFPPNYLHDSWRDYLFGPEPAKQGGFIRTKEDWWKRVPTGRAFPENMTSDEYWDVPLESE